MWRRNLLILLTIALIVAVVWVAMLFERETSRDANRIGTEYRASAEAIETKHAK